MDRAESRKAALSIRYRAACGHEHSHIEQAFREQVGASPVQWIANARVRRAQQLLETTNMSIEEVAAEVGFRSASVLREHFGGILGTTPIAYRRAFRERPESSKIVASV